MRYPESARLPDALLKLGYIYGEAGEIDRAREVLQKLVQAYPNTQAANLAERRLQALR
ncbi:tetratricopeptide repeat protein [Candidatus Competibacter phosphatis]|uniref:tetratricopeptide repeat protein n=1 Tax=Candidatus Competibacter phosphatis TaxID=221280 RepID=UPI003B9682CE